MSQVGFANSCNDVATLDFFFFFFLIVFFFCTVGRVCTQVYISCHKNIEATLNLLKRMQWSELPGRASISEWAKLHELKRVVGTPTERSMVIADANNNLCDLLRRLRSLGVAIHLREVIALRAAQILENPRLAAVMKTKKLAMLPTSKKQAAVAATLRAARTGTGDAFDRNKLDEIVTDAVAIVEQRAHSYVSIGTFIRCIHSQSLAGRFCLRRGQHSF
jgi:hypothetical protein